MRLDDLRCSECGHIQYRALWYWIKGKALHFVKAYKRCAVCGRREVYEKIDGKWVCWDCWSDVTGLPF